MAEQHAHPHRDTQQILNRISHAAGHLNAVGQMVQDGRDCPEVLIQLAAVRAAINSVGRLINSDHMAHCVAEAAETGDQAALERFADAIDKFLK